MAEELMILPSKDVGMIRLVKVPEDLERHEAYRHVTGLISEIEEQSPDYTWEDILELLADHGFEGVDFLLGPALD